MKIVLQPETNFFKRLVKNFKEQQDQDAIINALFYVHHPLALNFERPFAEKRSFVDNFILRGITEYAELEKKGLVRFFTEDCFPAEIRGYHNLKMMFDSIMNNISASITKDGKTSPALLKEYRGLIKDFADIKESLEKERNSAREKTNLKTLGNEILSFRDKRSLEDFTTN